MNVENLNIVSRAQWSILMSTWKTRIDNKDLGQGVSKSNKDLIRNRVSIHVYNMLTSNNLLVS